MKKINFKEALSLFQESLAVIDNAEGSVYIPFVREDWGDEDFNDLIMNDLLGSLYDITLKARIKEKVNDTNVHEIDLVLARNSTHSTESLLLFKNSESNNEIFIDYDDNNRNRIWNLSMTELVMEEELYLTPLGYISYNFGE